MCILLCVCAFVANPIPFLFGQTGQLTLTLFLVLYPAIYES